MCAAQNRRLVTAGAIGQRVRARRRAVRHRYRCFLSSGVPGPALRPAPGAPGRGILRRDLRLRCLRAPGAELAPRRPARGGRGGLRRPDGRRAGARDGGHGEGAEQLRRLLRRLLPGLLPRGLRPSLHRRQALSSEVAPTRVFAPT